MRWIKVRAEVVDDPAVMQIGERLGLDTPSVLGSLVLVWLWADAQTVDGVLPGVTPAMLDRVARREGFARAMQDAGWLRELRASPADAPSTRGFADSAPASPAPSPHAGAERSEAPGHHPAASVGGIELVNFLRHNGSSAKARALAVVRQQKYLPRATHAVIDGRPSPEKRREEKKKEQSRTARPPGAGRAGGAARSSEAGPVPQVAPPPPRDEGVGTSPELVGTDPRDRLKILRRLALEERARALRAPPPDPHAAPG